MAGELIAFGLVGLVALGLSVGLVDRRGATWGLRLLARRQGLPGAARAATAGPQAPPPRKPLHLVDPGRLGRFWEG